MSYAAWVITLRDARDGEAVASALSRRLGLPVYPVVDPGGLGNLGGTLYAWAQTRHLLQPLLSAGLPVAIVHDAGNASRSRPLSTSAGSRGAIWMPGELAPLQPRTQLDTVIDGLRHAAAGAGPIVDVHWGSQLVLCPPLPPLPAAIDLAKLARPWRAGDHSPDLGLIEHKNQQLRALHLAGTVNSDEQAYAIAPADQLARDIGSFRVRPELLDALEPTEADLDPGLLAPTLTGQRSGVLHANRIGVLLLPPDTLWTRLRRPAEHLSAGLELFHDPRLRAALGIEHPVTRCALGDTWVEGPELSWAEVAAGVRIGGVHLERSWLLGSTLAPDSRISDAGVGWSRGQFQLDSAVCMNVQAPSVAASGSLVYAVRSSDAVRARQAVVAGTARGLLEAAIHIDARRQPHGIRLVPGAMPPSQVHPGSSRSELEHDMKNALEQRDFERIVPWLTHPSPAVAQVSTAAWLRPLMERCDTLDAARRDDVIADLCELWSALKSHTDLPAVDALPSSTRLLRAAQRLRSHPPSPPPRAAHIAVLSRITVGADLHLLRPVLHELHTAYPSAQLTLIAPPASLDLLSGLPRVRGFRLAYARGGSLSSRLASWASVRALLDELSPDLVVSPDTRIDQLGTLPLLPERTLFLDTTLPQHSTHNLAQHIQQQLCDWLGTEQTRPPSLPLTSPSAPLPNTIALKLGVGGDPRKQLDVEQERAWLRGHLDAGRRVVLDLGIGAEVKRAATVLHGLRHAPLSRDPAANDDTHAQVLTFEGSLLDWAHTLARCTAAQGYDSVQGHLAAALGIPTDVVFLGHPSERFRQAWTPQGADVRALDSRALGPRATLAALTAPR